MTENVKHEENEWHVHKQMPTCQKQQRKLRTRWEKTEGKWPVGKAEQALEHRI